MQMNVISFCRASDVQLDFTMLDPHVRVFLKHDNEVHIIRHIFRGSIAVWHHLVLHWQGAAALEGGLHVTSCRELFPQHSRSLMCMVCLSG